MIKSLRKHLFVALIPLSVLAGCTEETAAPEPQALTRAAVGHYCNMIVVDHPGPKAQVFESGQQKPLWFSSVRDAFAYNALPGEAQNVVATYVHDMSQADNWKRPPDDGIWIKAEDAHYVIDSSRRGGMGAQETVPFATAAAAETFKSQFGGRVVTYGEIPKDYVVGDTKDHKHTDHKPGEKKMDHQHHAH